MKKVVKRLFGLSSFIFALAAVAYILLNPYFLSDWMALRGYEPSARIESIAESTSMTEHAKKLFYVHDPKIEGSAEFNRHCIFKEATIVLGCYDGHNIYVYDVSDERLDGVHEVTAVHEMLHAAYERLDEKERQKVDDLIVKEYSKITDSRIRSTVEAYRSRDASVVNNELHSILATEVRTLSAELEEYYSQYFDNRLSIVAFSESYEQVFSEIKNQVDRLDAQLTLLKSQIDAMEKDLESRAIIINNERDKLNRLLAQNNIASYNALIPAYNDLINSYNTDLEVYKKQIDDYNSKVVERNNLTVIQNDLVDSLDSKAPELE